MRKKAIPTDKNGRPVNRAQTIMASVVKSFSIIAIIVAIILVAVLYFGPELSLNGSIVIDLAIPSIILAFAISIVYTLWVTNGQEAAAKVQAYIDALADYKTKSDCLHYPTLQLFLDYEQERRRQVEYDTLTRFIDREEGLLVKMEKALTTKRADRLKVSKFKQFFKSRGRIDSIVIRLTKRRIRKWKKSRDFINIILPYEKSEEFDYLRNNTFDTAHKEHSPKDAQKHVRKAKRKKYVKTFVFTIVGFNILSIGAATGITWAAIVLTALAAVSLVMGAVQGYMTGYKNINVISMGVYLTGISYLDRGVAWGKATEQTIYYDGTNQFKQRKIDPEDELPFLDGSEFKTAEVEIEKSIFTNAAFEVAKTNY
jgi:ABC-type multidrug transport system fused ATPase/permease subunit